MDALFSATGRQTTSETKPMWPSSGKQAKERRRIEKQEEDPKKNRKHRCSFTSGKNQKSISLVPLFSPKQKTFKIIIFNFKLKKWSQNSNNVWSPLQNSPELIRLRRLECHSLSLRIPASGCSFSHTLLSDRSLLLSLKSPLCWHRWYLLLVSSSPGLCDSSGPRGLFTIDRTGRLFWNFVYNHDEEMC